MRDSQPVDNIKPQHDLDAQKQGRARPQGRARSIEVTAKGYSELAKQPRNELAYQRVKEQHERDREFFALGYDAGFKRAANAAGHTITMPPPGLPDGWEGMSAQAQVGYVQSAWGRLRTGLRGR